MRNTPVKAPAQAAALGSGAQAPGVKDAGRTLAQWLECSDADLERADPLEIDLAVARSIGGLGEIDPAVYAAKLDEWAAQVRAETDRHLYRFQQSPGEYKNSLAYFKALVMVTVVGQDFGVSYDTDAVAFDDPAELFVHGVIERKRGTCVSLPVLYMALGHRLGYPIRAVAVPKHMFCRWEDVRTGERFNIEAANAGGLSDYRDEHYQTWPTGLDPKDVETGGALKTLTMREFLGCKLASRGDYYWHKGMRPQAQTSYVLAHQCYPASRSIYEVLVGQLADEAERYDWSPVLQWTRSMHGDSTPRAPGPRAVSRKKERT